MLANGIRETSTTTGTGSVTLASVTGFTRFSNGFAISSLASYAINDGNNWEWGIGTVGAGNILDRTTITATLVSGVYTTTSATAISLASGAAVVMCVEHTGTVQVISNLTGMVTSVGNTTSLGSFTSAQLAGALTDETGTGSVVLNTLPTMSIYANALTFQDDIDPTKIAKFSLNALATGAINQYTLPSIGSTLASLGNISQTFTGQFTVSPSTSTSMITIGSSSGTGQIAIGRSTFGQTIVLGSALSGTSQIDIGRTRSSLTVNIATATNSISPKNINIGTNSSGGSTYITIGEPTYQSVTIINGLMIQGVYTLATIPVPTTLYGGFVAGCRSFINDAMAPVFGSIVVGGGSVNIPVYHDGTNWRVG